MRRSVASSLVALVAVGAVVAVVAPTARAAGVADSMITEKLAKAEECVAAKDYRCANENARAALTLATTPPINASGTRRARRLRALSAPEAGDEEGAEEGWALLSPAEQTETQSRLRSVAIAICERKETQAIMLWRLLPPSDRADVVARCRRAGHMEPIEAAVVDAAQLQYVHGQYDATVHETGYVLDALTERDFREHPGAWMRIVRVYGVASCFRHDQVHAKWAWNHLGDVERRFLAYVCSKNGIKLGGERGGTTETE